MIFAFTVSIIADNIILIDFGGEESGNIMEHNGWQTVFMDIYTDYRNIGPGGTITVSGSNDSYNYQGIRGDPIPFEIGDTIVVNWYNNSVNPITFSPKISFNDPDRSSSGANGVWYSMSQITISSHSDCKSIYNISTNSANTYSLVNVNVNSDKTDSLICDKIILSGIQSDNQLPTAPSNLHATAISAYRIDLSWIASTDNIGVVGYKIYRNSVQVGTSGNNQYSDTNLSPSSPYLYFVTAYDLIGNESVVSDSVVEETDEGDVITHKFISFDSQTGNHQDGFDNWHYATNLGPHGYAGGFYSDPDYIGEIREFEPYYNHYNSNHMGWLRWGYIDVDTLYSVRGNGYMKFVMTGGAYDSNGVVAYSGLEVTNKEQFDEYIVAGQNVYSDIDLPGGMSFYVISSQTNSRHTFEEAQGTDRLSVWVYLPKDLNQKGKTRPEITLSFYPFIDDGGGRHYYNYVTNTGMGGWTHILFDAHPLHCNSGDQNPYSYYRVGGYDCPGDAVQFFNRIARFSLRFGNPIPYSPTAIFIDEIEFYKIPQPENDETVANIGIGFDPDSNYFDIGFCDKYRGSVCDALYEVRYSFEEITNENYTLAKLCNIIQDTSVNYTYITGEKGQVKKPSPGYNQIWALLKLDLEDENQLQEGKTIHFAIKDISNRSFSNQDTFDTGYIYFPNLNDSLRRIDLVKTINYTIYASPDIGINEGDIDIKVYPNPCRVDSGQNYITFINISSGDKIELFNVLGKCIFNSGILTNNTFRWDVKNVSSGIYFYKITGSNKATGKIVIIR